MARWTALITPEESVPYQPTHPELLQQEEVVPGAAAAAADTPTSPSVPLEEEDENEEDQVEELEGQLLPAPRSPPETPPALVEAKEHPSPPQPVPALPGCRGGHQMVMDSQAQVGWEAGSRRVVVKLSHLPFFQTIYLFGGWNGHHDLSDFWSYDVPSNVWTLISANTEADGGPRSVRIANLRYRRPRYYCDLYFSYSPRSCHKMVLDAGCKHLFVLGRYLERGHRDCADSFRGDFYVYDIPASRWTLITDDTASMGGPALVFDHQMCIDQHNRTIYVFGGLSLAP